MLIWPLRWRCMTGSAAAIPCRTPRTFTSIIWIHSLIFNASGLDGVRFMRADGPIAHVPVTYEPSIVIVCQGRKRGFLDAAVYTYDPHHYLVLLVPLPFELDTQASLEEPMLAVVVSIDLKLAAELVLLLDARHRRQPSAATGICSTPLDDAMSDALLRLLQALGLADEAPILGPGIFREVLYRVLAARRAARSTRDAGMSVAAFHAHFKAVTRTTPIQYLDGAGRRERGHGIAPGGIRKQLGVQPPIQALLRPHACAKAAVMKSDLSCPTATAS